MLTKASVWLDESSSTLFQTTPSQGLPTATGPIAETFEPAPAYEKSSSFRSGVIVLLRYGVRDGWCDAL
jgi:hypothetical protein